MAAARVLSRFQRPLWPNFGKAPSICVPLSAKLIKSCHRQDWRLWKKNGASAKFWPVINSHHQTCPKKTGKSFRERPANDCKTEKIDIWPKAFIMFEWKRRQLPSSDKGMGIPSTRVNTEEENMSEVVVRPTKLSDLSWLLDVQEAGQPLTELS